VDIRSVWLLSVLRWCAGWLVVPSINMNRKLIQYTGPVFDAHDVRLVIIPGSVGVVAAIMILSFCEGMLQLPLRWQKY
jgi:hypothetical protein